VGYEVSRSDCVALSSVKNLHIQITLATLFGTTWILLVGLNILVANYLPINFTLKILIYSFSDNSSNASPTALTQTGFI